MQAGGGNQSFKGRTSNGGGINVVGSNDRFPGWKQVQEHLVEVIGRQIIKECPDRQLTFFP